MTEAKVEYETCNVCLGRGVIPTPRGDKYQLCPRCGGTGKVRKRAPFPEDVIQIWKSSWGRL